MKFIARKPITGTMDYLKHRGLPYSEHRKFSYCPRCKNMLNAGPNYQPKYCSECGQKIDFTEVKWENV